MRDLHRNVLTLHFTALGDSLAHGTGATRAEDGFVQRIYRSLARPVIDHSFTNLSVPGATINDVLTWQASHIPGASDVIFLVVGSNDVPTTTDPTTFAQEYGRLLGRVRAGAPNARLFVAGIPNIAVTPHVPDEAKPLVATLCSLLSVEIEMQAATYRAEFIDLFSITSRVHADASKYLSEDCFHPSDRGYALLARGALPVFDAVLK